MQWFFDGRKNYKGPQVELVGETRESESEDKEMGMIENDK